MEFWQLLCCTVLLCLPIFLTFFHFLILLTFFGGCSLTIVRYAGLNEGLLTEYFIIGLWRLDKDEFIVILIDNWSFTWRHAIVKENKILENFHWLASRVMEEQFDANDKLSPTHLMYFKRRSFYCNFRFRETGVELENNLLYELWYVLTLGPSDVAAPSVCLCLQHFLASIHCERSKHNRLWDYLMSSSCFDYLPQIRLVLNPVHQFDAWNSLNISLHKNNYTD